MPKELKVYECELCHRRYDKFSDATICENNGLPSGGLQEELSKVKIGDFLEFNEENGGFSSHWSYQNKKGKVLAKYISCNGDGLHKWVVIVSVSLSDDGPVCYERGVVEVHNEGLMSPNEFSYKIGFANHLIESDIAYKQ